MAEPWPIERGGEVAVAAARRGKVKRSGGVVVVATARGDGRVWGSRAGRWESTSALTLATEAGWVMDKQRRRGYIATMVVPMVMSTYQSTPM